MEKKSIVYEFNLSAPYPDENGVAMQGTAYRIESWKGEARAYNVKEATAYILRHETIKKVFEHNSLNIEEIIERTDEKQEEVQTMFIVSDSGLVVHFSVKEKQ